MELMKESRRRHGANVNITYMRECQPYGCRRKCPILEEKQIRDSMSFPTFIERDASRGL